MTGQLLLVTGATGLIGSHVAELAIGAGYRLRVLARPESRGLDWLKNLGAEIIFGDLADQSCLSRATRGVDAIVHSAATVGDWGPAAVYQRTNVDGINALLAQAQRTANLQRFVALSSLGVYAPKDHFGTDETVPLNTAGMDPYTRTKAAAELKVVAAAKAGLPAVILRPGFVYGPRDRHVLPNLMRALRRGTFTYIGTGEQLLDHTNVANIAAAVLAALRSDHCIGEIFNITDEPLVSRRVFIETVASYANLPLPKAHMPRWCGHFLAQVMDKGARTLGRTEPPLLSLARYKFLALHLEYSITKAKNRLNYRPSVDFRSGMRTAVEWFLAQEQLSHVS